MKSPIRKLLTLAFASLAAGLVFTQGGPVALASDSHNLSSTLKTHDAFIVSGDESTHLLGPTGNGATGDLGVEFDDVSGIAWRSVFKNGESSATYARIDQVRRHAARSQAPLSSFKDPVALRFSQYSKAQVDQAIEHLIEYTANSNKDLAYGLFFSAKEDAIEVDCAPAVAAELPDSIDGVRILKRTAR